MLREGTTYKYRYQLQVGYRVRGIWSRDCFRLRRCILRANHRPALSGAKINATLLQVSALANDWWLKLNTQAILSTACFGLHL